MNTIRIFIKRSYKRQFILFFIILIYPFLSPALGEGRETVCLPLFEEGGVSVPISMYETTRKMVEYHLTPILPEVKNEKVTVNWLVELFLVKEMIQKSIKIKEENLLFVLWHNNQFKDLIIKDLNIIKSKDHEFYLAILFRLSAVVYGLYEKDPGAHLLPIMSPEYQLSHELFHEELIVRRNLFDQLKEFVNHLISAVDDSEFFVQSLPLKLLNQ